VHRHSLIPQVNVASMKYYVLCIVNYNLSMLGSGRRIYTTYFAPELFIKNHCNATISLLPPRFTACLLHNPVPPTIRLTLSLVPMTSRQKSPRLLLKQGRGLMPTLPRRKHKRLPRRPRRTLTRRKQRRRPGQLRQGRPPFREPLRNTRYAHLPVLLTWS